MPLSKDATPTATADLAVASPSVVGRSEGGQPGLQILPIDRVGPTVVLYRFDNENGVFGGGVDET